MRFVLLTLALPLAACSETYHPEFHPVSVTHVVVTGQTPVVVTAPSAAIPFDFLEPLDKR